MAGIGHRGFMGRSASSFCPYLPGLYTESEIDDLVFIDGYVPVYDISEHQKVSLGGSQTMGGCSKWSGTYTTGLDKKYIQVKAFDGSTYGTFGSFTTIANDFTGVYDGNNYVNTNLQINLVGSFIGNISGAIVRNIIIEYSEMFFTTAVGGSYRHGGIVCRALNSSIVNNCHIRDSHIKSTITNPMIIGGLIGINIESSTVSNCSVTRIQITSDTSTPDSAANQCGGFVGENGITGAGIITNCTVDGVVFNTPLWYMGGFVGVNQANGVITGCSVENITSFTSFDRSGGFVGYNNGGQISQCKVDSAATTITSVDQRIGGFVGFANTPGTIQECWTNVNVSTSGIYAGGFAGINNGASGMIRNSYAYGNVMGSAATTGGFCGQNLNGADMEYCYSIGTSNGGGLIGSNGAGSAVTDSYWDTDTSGNATSAAGVGKTTSELQTPTSNTGIYAAWTIPPWAFGTATDYPSLTTTP